MPISAEVGCVLTAAGLWISQFKLNQRARTAHHDFSAWAVVLVSILELVISLPCIGAGFVSSAVFLLVGCALLISGLAGLMQGIILAARSGDPE
jgi:hypothetical protein